MNSNLPRLNQRQEEWVYGESKFITKSIYTKEDEEFDLNADEFLRKIGVKK